MSWSIAIKTVGSRATLSPTANTTATAAATAAASPTATTAHPPLSPDSALPKTEKDAPAASPGPSLPSNVESNFVIEVDPDDSLVSLHDKIEMVTGLQASQQRLIYRGRIINTDVPAGASSSRTSSPSSDASRELSTQSAAAIPVAAVADDAASSSAASTGTAPSPAAEGKIEHSAEDGKRRIRDVDGLCDGQTIHLVPRLLPSAVGAGSSRSSANAPSRPGGLTLAGLGEGATGLVGGGPNVASISGADGVSLIAALLGLSSVSGTANSGAGSGGFLGLLDDVARDGDNASMGAGPGNLGPVAGLDLPAGVTRGTAGGPRGPVAPGPTAAETFPRLAPLSGRRLRRANYPSSRGGARSRARAARLTETDIRAPDPGAIEPVRQGLMTLHTLIGNALRPMKKGEEPDMDGVCDGASSLQDVDSADVTSSVVRHNPSLTSPLDAHRQWYRGQWIDALDTVNQWLEATVVDIVLPSDILPPRDHKNDNQRCSSSIKSQRKSRRRTTDAVVSANDLEGRRRLLLESTSEPDADESDQSTRDAAEDGYLERDDNEGVQLLLIHYNGWPHRWDEWIRSDSERIRPFRTRTRHRSTSQHASPIPQAVFQAAPATHIMDEDHEIERASLLPELQRVLSSVNKVLVDALPHEPTFSPNTLDSTSSSDTSHLPWRLPNHGIAASVTSTGEISPDEPNSPATTYNRRPDPRSQFHRPQLLQLAPIIDRLGRTLTDAAPHIAALADSLPPSSVSAVPAISLDLNSLPPLPEDLLFGIDDAAGRDQTTPSPVPAQPAPGAEEQRETETLNDPDLSDYINGMVNIARGEVRGGRDSNRDPVGSSLLASYLSSSGLGSISGQTESSEDSRANLDNPLGRVVRVGSGNGGGTAAGGPGIDIHIHAIVTGPGMTNFGLGGLGLGVGTVTTPPTTGGDAATTDSNDISSAVVGATEPQGEQTSNEVDMDLFSDLYTESPPPVNPHSNETATEFVEDSQSDLSQHFEDVESAVSEPSSSPGGGSAPFLESSVSCSEVAPETTPRTQVDSESAVDDSTYDSIDGVGSTSQGSAVTSTSSQRENSRSPSLGNRLFRRTIGRLSNSSRRTSGSSPPSL